MENQRIRVRFAPSPTGPLHIGGVRTALYNYLFAKKHGGDFILRIEDTDQTRFVAGAEEYIIEAFKWCGIEFNEGVSKGGPHAPYKQSERKPIYRQYAEQLVNGGHAYYAFDTPEELDDIRKRLETQNNTTFQYNAVIRQTMKNSLSLPEDEVKRRINDGEPYVIRIKIPENETICFHDIVRDEVTVNTSTLDDKVLFKSDGMPTYHLANVVDDYLMKITHVIRGEEWLPSTPAHVFMYRCFGWEASMPKFVHMPLTLKPDGKGKLSKRDGDRLGFPVFPLQWTDPKTGEISSGFREKGYLPEAFINILAFLGWNPGTEQEIFTMEEMIQAFTLERIGKSGSKFDPEKAKWYNHQYIQKKSNEQLAELFRPMLKEKGITAGDEFITKVCGLIKERVILLPDLWEQSHYFFIAPSSYDEQIIKKKWKEDTSATLNAFKDELNQLTDFHAESIKKRLEEFSQKNNSGVGQMMNPLRLTLVGGSLGPDLFSLMELLGKDETVKRIVAGLQAIQKRD